MTRITRTVATKRIWGKGRTAVIFFNRDYVEVFNDYSELNYRSEEATSNYSISVVHYTHGYASNADAGHTKDSFISKTLTKEQSDEIMNKAKKGKEGLTYETLLSDLTEKGLIEVLKA